MEQTRCKFNCHSVTKTVGWSGGHKFMYTVNLNAVTSDTPENKTFWEYTPGGSLSLCCIYPDLFQPGKEYYLDITPVE